MIPTRKLELGCLEKTCFMEGFSHYLIECNKMQEDRAKMYVNLVRRFHNHVGKSYVDIKQADIQSYLSFLKNEEELKDRSIYVHLVAIKKFYNYLWRRGEVTKIPSDGLRIRYWNKKSPHKQQKRKADFR